MKDLFKKNFKGYFEIYNKFNMFHVLAKNSRYTKNIVNILMYLYHDLRLSNS